MPIPPKVGVGASCQRSAVGTATSRRPTVVRSSAQITPAATGKATIATVVLTGAERSRLRLAPCEDGTWITGPSWPGATSRRAGRPVPTLVRDGGVRRPRALSRPVREPVPAGLPGEVPRVGAGGAVVARKPARARRRLPGRRRRDLEQDEGHPALPALPALRDRLLALLRGLAAVGGAVDGRQRAT